MTTVRWLQTPLGLQAQHTRSTLVLASMLDYGDQDGWTWIYYQKCFPEAEIWQNSQTGPLYWTGDRGATRQGGTVSRAAMVS